jgi:hypothetical protein
MRHDKRPLYLTIAGTIAMALGFVISGLAVYLCGGNVDAINAAVPGLDVFCDVLFLGGSAMNIAAAWEAVKRAK